MRKRGLSISQENLSINSTATIWKDALGLTEVQEIFLASFEEIKNESKIIVDESEEDLPMSTVIMDSFPVTRSSKRLNPSVSETRVIRNEASATHADWVSIQTPAAEGIVSGDRHSEEHGISSVAPVHENGTIRWSNVPRQPIPKLDDVSLWIGHQLNHERMPAKYQHMAPEGELVASLDGYPDGLLAIPGNNNGPPRIIVPRSQIKALVLHAMKTYITNRRLKFCTFSSLYTTGLE